MIEVITGNLIDSITEENTPLNVVRAICHGTNCQGVMGSGFAAFLRKKYPKVFVVYRNEYETKGLYLGGTSTAIGNYETFQLWNLNTQEFYRNYKHTDGSIEPSNKVYCDYGAVNKSFSTMSAELCNYFGVNYIRDGLVPDTEINTVEIHFPLIGCGLANGEWDKVREQIEAAVHPDIKLFLWRLPE
jgi:hypothetical protein